MDKHHSSNNACWKAGGPRDQDSNLEKLHKPGKCSAHPTRAIAQLNQTYLACLPNNEPLFLVLAYHTLLLIINQQT